MTDTLNIQINIEFQINKYRKESFWYIINLYTYVHINHADRNCCYIRTFTKTLEEIWVKY